jgi:hypothetical protein
VNRLKFEVLLRPVSSNHLYPGKARRYPSMDGLVFKQRIIDAALSAADKQGWDLCYSGPVCVVIVDYRPTARGTDVDSWKAILDALQPQILLNDREAWSYDTRIVVDRENPRIVVLVTKTTREEIAAEAARLLA